MTENIQLLYGSAGTGIHLWNANDLIFSRQLLICLLIEREGYGLKATVSGNRCLKEDKTIIRIKKKKIFTNIP